MFTHAGEAPKNHKTPRTPTSTASHPCSGSARRSSNRTQPGPDVHVVARLGAHDPAATVIAEHRVAHEVTTNTVMTKNGSSPSEMPMPPGSPAAHDWQSRTRSEGSPPGQAGPTARSRGSCPR